MATDLPYMAAIGNIGSIFDRIMAAGTPERFTHEFLSKSLGFTSSNDRGAIKVLKNLGFLSSDSVPTQRYAQFRSEGIPSRAIAIGLREGWEKVFLARENAQELGTSELQDIFQGVAGVSSSVGRKMASTFKSLADLADWSGVPDREEPTSNHLLGNPDDETLEELGADHNEADLVASLDPGTSKPLRLHHDVHVHLPTTTDPDVYRAIFRAISAELV